MPFGFSVELVGGLMMHATDLRKKSSDQNQRVYCLLMLEIPWQQSTKVKMLMDIFLLHTGKNHC